mmetsp:Transcript_90427/g.193884  ORF Transcript_90427/g.193884 Transcript_90427/m.193884 type:complete len:204 (+) Transcript_90427:264-875(+)
MVKDLGLPPLAKEQGHSALWNVLTQPQGLGLLICWARRHIAGKILDDDLLPSALFGHGKPFPSIDEQLLRHEGGVQVLEHRVGEAKAAPALSHGAPVVTDLVHGRERRLHEILLQGIYIGCELIVREVPQLLWHELCVHALDGRFHVVGPEDIALDNATDVHHVRDSPRPCAHHIAELPGSPQLIVGDGAEDLTQQGEHHAAL